MRKTKFLILLTFSVIFLLISCDDEEDSLIGTTGPGGGIIFYDKGSYSDGWRFLEAAPQDLDGTYSWTEAKNACENYYTIVNGKKYIGWYLPDQKELNDMYLYLVEEGLGSFEYNIFYWTSTEVKSTDGTSESEEAYAIKFYEEYGIRKRFKKIEEKCVRPIRAC